MIRAEAAAEDNISALDLALDKMAAQMRSAADRRREHKSKHRVADLLDEPALQDGGPSVGASPSTPSVRSVRSPSPARGRSWSARRPTGHAMTLDQALYEMELVGHDFYLYVDKDTERPCVVYRRRGYDYGVISLDLRGVAHLTHGCTLRTSPVWAIDP